MSGLAFTDPHYNDKDSRLNCIATETDKGTEGDTQMVGQTEIQADGTTDTAQQSQFHTHTHT